MVTKLYCFLKAKRRLYLFITTIAILVGGCGSGISSKEKKDTTSSEFHFTLPEIPVMITDVESRRQYLTEHYWDKFDFSNTELLENDSILGSSVAAYIQLLQMSDSTTIANSVDNALSNSLKVGYTPFEKLTSILEEYLYNPNSPMRNEEIYIYVLRYITEVSSLEDIYKLRVRKQLTMVLKNRVGEVAIDFSYVTKEGRKSTLYAVQSPYTLLFFNTPDCDDCVRVKQYIAQSSKLNILVKAGALTILAIYTESDFEMWREASYPSILINGADMEHAITDQKLYDLKALPSVYLLDSEKKVLLKDGTIEEIESFL